MLWSNKRAALILLLCLATLPGLFGCGYSLSSDMPSVLGEPSASLKLTGVEQPTLYPWVVYTLRSALRDEINARNLARWVDSGNADYNMHIKVNFLTMRGAVSSDEDRTLLYNGSTSLTAVIYNGADNTELWRNTVNYSNNFASNDEESAARELFTQAVRRLADSMRNTF